MRRSATKQFFSPSSLAYKGPWWRIKSIVFSSSLCTLLITRFLFRYVNGLCHKYSGLIQQLWILKNRVELGQIGNGCVYCNMPGKRWVGRSDVCFLGLNNSYAYCNPHYPSPTFMCYCLLEIYLHFIRLWVTLLISFGKFGKILQLGVLERVGRITLLNITIFALFRILEE